MNGSARVGRAGFTLIELLLGGAILATISFGALVGVIRISDFVDKRGEMMAADGFCWDLAWKLFNDDAEAIRALMTTTAEEVTAMAEEDPPEEWPYPGRPSGAPQYLEITGEVLPAGSADRQDGGNYDFLSHLQYPGSPPKCFITLSNRWDSANGVYDESGVFISVNLEWGPAGERRVLMPYEGMDARRVKHVFNHPVSVYRSFVSGGAQ